jgi:transposase
LSRHKAAALFSVGVSSVIRWCQRKSETGGVAAKPMGGKVKPKLLPHRDWVLARVKAEPSLTLGELRAELAERDVRVAVSTIWKFLEHEKLSFKKNSARQRARAA